MFANLPLVQNYNTPYGQGNIPGAMGSTVGAMAGVAVFLMILFSLVGIGIAILYIWGYWKIVTKAGYPGYWAILITIIPIVNIIYFFKFAFGDWPVLQELMALRQRGIPLPQTRGPDVAAGQFTSQADTPKNQEQAPPVMPPDSQEKPSFSTNTRYASSVPYFNPAAGRSDLSTAGLNTMDKPTLTLIILGVICFIDYFLPWNTVSEFFIFVTIPGYYGWGSFSIVLLIAFFVWIGLSLGNVQIPLNQNQKRLIRLGLALGIAFFTILRILFSLSAGLTVEGWLGLLVALSIGGIDAYLYLKENGLISRFSTVTQGSPNQPYNQPTQTRITTPPQKPETVNPLDSPTSGQPTQFTSSKSSINPEAARKFCPNCGNEIQPSDVFCGNCGKKLIT